MNNSERTSRFAALHVKGSPLRLYNAWDAGSAKTIADSGAQAIATSSWAVAAAQGYRDGENMPLNLVEQVVQRIVQTIELPVTVDFEGGYGESDAELTGNIGRLLEIGVAGINFEDRVVHGEGLYAPDRQALRISALRKAADEFGAALFINARSDVFFGSNPYHAALMKEARQRAALYRDAGASGFFVPGLIDEELIGDLTASVDLPVNVMMMSNAPSIRRLIELGVSRISYGNIPYVIAATAVAEKAKAAFSTR